MKLISLVVQILIGSAFAALIVWLISLVFGASWTYVGVFKVMFWIDVGLVTIQLLFGAGDRFIDKILY